MNQAVILYAGLFTTVLFLIGFGLTIREFQELKDERKMEDKEIFPEESNAKIKK